MPVYIHVQYNASSLAFIIAFIASSCASGSGCAKCVLLRNRWIMSHLVVYWRWKMSQCILSRRIVSQWIVGELAFDGDPILYSVQLYMYEYNDLYMVYIRIPGN